MQHNPVMLHHLCHVEGMAVDPVANGRRIQVKRLGQILDGHVKFVCGPPNLPAKAAQAGNSGTVAQLTARHILPFADHILNIIQLHGGFPW